MCVNDDVMVDEDMEVFECMMVVMEVKECEVVDDYVMSWFLKMCIVWEVNVIEGGVDVVVVVGCVLIDVGGGCMKEFVGYVFYELVWMKSGLSVVCEVKLAKKVSMAALDEEAMDDFVDFDFLEFKMKKMK